MLAEEEEPEQGMESIKRIRDPKWQRRRGREGGKDRTEIVRELREKENETQRWRTQKHRERRRQRDESRDERDKRGQNQRSTEEHWTRTERAERTKRRLQHWCEDELLIRNDNPIGRTGFQASGRVTYCGHELSEFVPQRMCAYISQHDLHHGEMTVRETLDFSGRCLGVGSRYELLAELSRRELAAGIKPDPEIDTFMKATAMEGQETSHVTDYILKILGLEICADILVGDEMKRGISGGQKKRLTAGDMLVGPAKALFMDEISTGLDSSTTFQIVSFMRQMVHIMAVTMIISLPQPAPETYDLFDDSILLSEGMIVYQGPRENVLIFLKVWASNAQKGKELRTFYRGNFQKGPRAVLVQKGHTLQMYQCG